MGNKKFWGDFRTLKSNITLPGGKIFNVYTPEYSIALDSIPKIDRSQNIRTRAGGTNYVNAVSYGSAYVQDELGFLNDQLRLSIAGRFTYAETVGKTQKATIKDNVFSPRIGLSYSVDKQTSVYALYDQSFVPQSGTDFEGKAFKPVRGNDMEVGIKKEWFGGRWRSSLTAYQILRKNTLTPDLEHSTGTVSFQAQLGETKTKGIEVDINGEVLPGLNVTANYAYTNSKISEEPEGVPTKTVGNVTPNTAAHVTNGWLQYRVQKGAFEGFGASAGIQWQADRYIGTTQVANFPNYFRGDAGLSLQRGKYNISLLVNNVFNNLKLLTAGSTTAKNSAVPTSVAYYSYIVEARRNFRMTVAYRF
jgi:iron complex outermembrane receptor protein